MNRLKRLIAKSVNAGLGQLGMRISRFEVDVMDLRRETSDPIEALYLSGGRKAVIDVPLADCLVLHPNAFRCVVGAANPFVEALRAYDQLKSETAARSCLAEFLDSWQPRSASEVLGVEPARAHADLREGAPLAYVLPWEEPDMRRAMLERKRFVAEKLTRAGIAPDPVSGWKCWGPCNDAVKYSEVARLVNVFESIRKHGFHRSARPDGDIGAVVLRANGANRYLVSPGHHRAAALAALGHVVAPVRVRSPIVRREDVDRWPAVRHGLYLKETALQVFDRIHAGVQPPALRAALGRRCSDARPMSCSPSPVTTSHDYVVAADK